MFDPQIPLSKNFPPSFINGDNGSPAYLDSVLEEKEETTFHEKKEKTLDPASNIESETSREAHTIQNLLIDPETGAIQPSSVRLRAQMLFTLFAQNGADQALHKKQDLIEWLENTLKMFESCQTLKSFFDCFEEDIGKFPDLFSLSKKLKRGSEKLLKGIDVFPVLESLKQDVSDNILYEISRIFSERQAENAKTLRLKNEEKAEAEEKCQRLMKEAGVSRTDSNIEREMSEAAWLYFKDITLVGKAIPLWQSKSTPSESEWTKELLSSLDDPASPYSRLPSHIKIGLKTYLTFYKKSTDYSEYIKLQNSLVGRPQITRFENGGLSILRITGGHLSLSGVFTLSELADLKGIDEIQILSRETMFLDGNMNDARFRGMNIVISGKTIDVTAQIVIDTSGLDALPHADKKARDGRSFSYSSSGSGYNGENGKSGNPGGSAGHVHIQACEIKGRENLHIIANGGKGADGQNGGAGDRGKDGQDGEDAEYYRDGEVNHAFRAFHIKRGTSGALGQSGGKGGDGGKGGQGGHAGLVIVRDNHQDYISRKIINLTAVPGQDGVSGEPGEGGEAGLDGRRGLDSIVAYTGGFTFQKDKYLKGWDVFAKLIKRGWFTKDTYDVFARVSEHQVKSTSRTPTPTHDGQVGTSIHYKNSAAQKAAINFSAILQQCPEVAASLSHSDSTTHKLNQKLDALFELGYRRQVLDNDIQHLEKEKKILSEKLKKLEETARRIANEAVLQRIAQHIHVTEQADPKSTHLPREKKESISPDFSFFQPMSNKEQKQNEKSAFDRLEKVVFQYIQDNYSKKARDDDPIFEWQQAIALISNRLEKDIEKIKSVCPDLKISQEEVYASLKKLIEVTAKKKALSSEDLKSTLYEMSIWHVSEPHLVEKILRHEKDLFQWLLTDPELLTENKYSRLKFALSFMRLDPADLDELRINGGTDHGYLKQLDRYYQGTFYKPRKDSVLSRKARLTPDAKQKIDALIKNIFFEMKRAGKGVGYAESVRIMDTLIREMDQSNELPLLKAKLFELLKLSRSTRKECLGETTDSEKSSSEEKTSWATFPSLAKTEARFGPGPGLGRGLERKISHTSREKHKSNDEIPSEEKYFLKLPDLPFPSGVYALGSEDYLAAKKMLAGFIEKQRTNQVWCKVFERVWEKLAITQVLPPIEELNLLFSIMASRENVSTLQSDLKTEELSSWGSKVLLGNIREKLRNFLLNKTTDITNLFEELDQKITKLFHQPAILNIFYQKLASEAALFDPRLAVSVEELNEILSAFEHLKERSHDSDFLSVLYKTPLPSWGRVLRERLLQQSLFDPASLKRINQKDQKRCLFLLCKLEENLGRQTIDRLVACIQKEESSVDYATLADLLMQVRYQQLTLNDTSLSLLEHAPFETWFASLLDFHKKETEKPRDLQTLLTILQNEAANKKIRDSLPLVVQQIQSIQTHLVGTSHRLTDLLFQVEEKEKKPACSMKSIDTWTEKDILEWSSAFRKQPDTRKLVEEHLSEIIAIISRAVFLEKGFYPRDVQYLALLTAFRGSDHRKKMISQIATGQGKTITGTMLALLRVLAGERVDFVTSSSVLAEETEEEIRSVTRMFGFTSACNTECHYGPYALELIEGKPSLAQIEQLLSNKGAAIIKEGEEYTLGFARKEDDIFIESYIELSEWPEFRKKIKENPFQSRKCTVKDELHEEVFKIIRSKGLQECISPAQDETLKLQENYRSDILCGDLESFMRAHLLTEFYGKNITQNRSAFIIMDEVDRLLDEMGDILYLSHDIPDMHHLNNLMLAIWETIHYPSCAEETEENILGLTQYFLNQLSPGDCSTAEKLQGKIQVPPHLEAFIRRRLPTWIRSAYIAKNGLSRDGEYIVAQMGEGEDRGVYLVDQDTGVTTRNKELANGVHQFLRLKHQDWPKALSLKAIYCDPISFLMEKYKNGFFGMTGTLGSEQDCRFLKNSLASAKDVLYHGMSCSILKSIHLF